MTNIFHKIYRWDSYKYRKTDVDRTLINISIARNKINITSIFLQKYIYKASNYLLRLYSPNRPYTEREKNFFKKGASPLFSLLIPPSLSLPIKAIMEDAN